MKAGGRRRLTGHGGYEWPFDVACTHLYVKGLRAHIKNAIGYGATREEILEVIELASVIGIHAATVGVPILVEELAAANDGGAG